MSNIVDEEFMQNARDLRRAGKEQAEIGMEDGISDFALTGGAWVDGLSAGVTVEEMMVCYFMADDPLDFERRVWVQIYKLGDKAKRPDLDAIKEVIGCSDAELGQYVGRLSAATNREGESDGVK